MLEFSTLLRDRDGVSADDREALLAALVLTMLANGAGDLVDADYRGRVAGWLDRHHLDLNASPDVIEARLGDLLGGRPGLRSLSEACAALVVGEVSDAEALRGQAAISRLGGVVATATFARAHQEAAPSGSVKATPLLRFQALTPAVTPRKAPALAVSPMETDGHDT